MPPAGARVTWIVGDIHGCALELSLLLQELPKDDLLVFLGDYVDRGPDSAGVVKQLLKLRHRARFLVGNHESMLLQHMNPKRERAWNAWLHPRNGGMATLQSYGLDERAVLADLPEGHRLFFTDLEPYVEESRFIAVHAGLRLEGFTSLAEQSREDLVWIREDWLNARDDWQGKTVYYGHTPTRHVNGLGREAAPIAGTASLGIDTGCVYGGYLTAAHVESGRLLQIRAREQYCRL